jgi:hypothetical protein
MAFLSAAVWAHYVRPPPPAPHATFSFPLAQQVLVKSSRLPTLHNDVVWLPRMMPELPSKALTVLSLTN